MYKKNRIWPIIYGLILTAFTAYAVLDTFVIARVYDTVEPSGKTNSYITQKATTDSSSDTEQADETDSIQLDTDSSVASEAVSTKDSYSDDNISIKISEYQEYDTTIYVADVQLTSPEYLKTAFAQSSYGRNVTEKASEIASEAGAILAINGDYYGARNSGYVIRNGVLYRDTSSGDTEDLVVYSDGSFGIINEAEVTAQELMDNGAMQVFSFGPAIVQNGSVAVSEGEEVGKAMASNPRTAIGIIDSCHYVLVVSDGRTNESEGLSLYQLAEFMQSIGVQTAYNLDGGGSSTMVFNGTVINNPTTNGRSIKERSVSDIVYIGY